MQYFIDKRTNWLILPILLILSAFFSAISCESHYNIQLTTTSAIEGESITLKCQATHLMGLEYTWTHNGQTVKNTSRVYQIESNLSIEKVNRSLDNGDYKCIATSIESGAREVSPITTLNVIWITSATVQQQTLLTIKHKNDIILKCLTVGAEPLTIEWFKNAEKIVPLPNSNYIIDERNRKLIIIKPTKLNDGVYQCSAKNDAGIVFSQNNYVIDIDIKKLTKNSNSNYRCSYKKSLYDLNLEMKNNDLFDYNNDDDDTIEIMKNIRRNNQGLYLCRGKRGGSDKHPELSTSTNDLSTIPENLIKPITVKLLIDENDGVTLNCDVTKGNKKNVFVVKWKKDDKPFRHIDINSPTSSPIDVNTDSGIPREDSRITTNRRNGSLIFSSVLTNDVGTYECQTFNEQDMPISVKLTDLKVIEQLKFVPSPTSKNLELGTMGKVHCKVQGTPTPQIKWIKEQLNELPETIEDINGTLIFRNVSMADRGNYSCIATNSQGKITATVSINTVVAPKFIIAPENQIQVLEMASTMVHCQAFGDPKPTVQWDKDLQYISNNSSESPRIHILENGTLHITEVHLDDEGRYGCTIGSSAGLKREEARLTVKPADDFTSEEQGDGFMITRAVLITMSVAFAYIILVVGLMLWCRYRRQIRKARLNSIDKDAVENGNNGDIKMGEIEPCLPVDKKKSSSSKMNGKTNHQNGKHNGGGGGDANSQKSDDTAASVTSKLSKKSSNFDQIALPRNVIVEMIQIGRGDFGDVFIGKIRKTDLKIFDSDDTNNTMNKLTAENEKHKSKTSLDEITEIKDETIIKDDLSSSSANDEYKHVLVKALNKCKDENVCVEFRRQIEMFRSVSHRSVSKLYGLCRDKDPHYLVLEYTDWGDLKQFLIATDNMAETNTKATTPLVTSQLLAIAHQIARGMDSIYRARYVHKDLATRNCIITNNFIVKISYSALNRDKYSKEYVKHKNVLMPIRWMAPEFLQDDDFSTKSDVFAFGVLVWELFKRAKSLPFENLTNDEFLCQHTENKLTWSLAEGTPSELTSLLTSCWSGNVKERPSFSQIYSALGKCLQNEKATELKE